MENILDFDYSLLKEKFLQINEPTFRATQIWEGLYKLNHSTWKDFTNLPISLRKSLTEKYRILSIRPIKEEKTIDNSTIKTLFELTDRTAKC